MSLLLEAKKLIKKRDELDSFIAEQQAVLKMSGVDMTTPLVDKDDYPLADVNIYVVRSARKALICAQNDREELNEQIEELIHSIHQQARGESKLNLLSSPHKHEVHRTSNFPFAKIDKVITGSPAHTAGLMAGDRLLQFGDLHAGNFKELKQLAPVVKELEGALLKITVIREGKPLRLELVPQKWSGPGLLGCSFLPLMSTKVL